jgi:hypothetical protein
MANLDKIESMIPLSGKYLFVFYLIVSSNYLGNVFGCRVQELLNNSMIMKHILGLMTLYFFNTLADTNNQQSALEKLVYSIVIYFVFLLSTKTNITFFIPFIICLGLSYVLYIAKDEYKENDELRDMAENAQKILVTLAVVILIAGFIYYFLEKKEEYGSEFRFDTFLLGNTKCRGSNEPLLKEN